MAIARHGAFCGSLAVVILLGEPEPPRPEETSGAFVVVLAPIVAAAPAPLFELPPGLPSVHAAEAPQITASAKAEPPPPEPELPHLPTLAPPEIALPQPVKDAKEAAKPAAPSTCVSERDRRTRTQWQGALSAHLVRHARFPAAVREHAQDRQVLVRFQLDRRGNVITVALA